MTPEFEKDFRGDYWLKIDGDTHYIGPIDDKPPFTPLQTIWRIAKSRRSKELRESFGIHEMSGPGGIRYFVSNE